MSTPEPAPTVRHPGSESSESGLRWFAVALLIGHLSLLTIGAVALWRIGGGWWQGAVAAAAVALAYAALWRFLLAPGAKRHLGYRGRFTVNLVLGPIIVILGSLAGLWLPGLLAASTVLLCDALNERGLHG